MYFISSNESLQFLNYGGCVCQYVVSLRQLFESSDKPSDTEVSGSGLWAWAAQVRGRRRVSGEVLDCQSSLQNFTY